MTKLKVFLPISDVYQLEKQVNDFIKDKKVISAQVFKMGAEVIVWIFYEEG